MPEKQKKKIRFALDRGALALLLLGACLVGGLLFADGLLVGMGVYRQSVWPVLVAGRQAQAQAAALAANAKKSAPHPAAPAATATSTATAANPAAAPAPAATTAAPAALTAVSAPAANCGLDVPLAAQASPTQPGFDLQLGAFEDAANAARLLASLKTQGCTAQIMQFTDAAHHVWNVVRIGPFATLDQAAQAAAQLRRAAGLLALVRPVSTI